MEPFRVTGSRSLRPKGGALVAVLVGFSAWGLAACRGGKDGGGNADPPVGLTVSGSLGAGYALPGFAGSVTTVDQVWAIRLGNDGEVIPSSFGDRKTFDIAEDGSFELSLETDGDYVLLLVDSTATERRDRIKSYLSIQDVSGTLIQIPAGDTGSGEGDGGEGDGEEGGGDHGGEGGDHPADGDGEGEGGYLELGECNEEGDEAVSTETLAESADVFSLTLDQLQEIARTDDVLKVIKNFYVNYDEESETYLNVWPGFAWRDTAGEVSIAGTFSDPAATVAGDNNGYTFLFQTNDPVIDIDTVCDQSKSYTLHPPATVAAVFGTGWWSFTKPFTNQGAVQNTGTTACGVGELYASEDTQSPGFVSFNFSGANGSNWRVPIVEGWWEHQVDGETVFEFDGALAAPFENGDPLKPYVYIPSVRAVATTGYLTAIDIKWYLRNEAGGFDEVTDFEIFDRVANEVGVSITDYSGTTGSGGMRIGENATMVGVTSAIPPSTWRIMGDASTTQPVAEDITIGYKIRDIGFRFEFQ